MTILTEPDLYFPLECRTWGRCRKTAVTLTQLTRPLLSDFDTLCDFTASIQMSIRSKKFGLHRVFSPHYVGSQTEEASKTDHNVLSRSLCDLVHICTNIGYRILDRTCYEPFLWTVVGGVSSPAIMSSPASS